MPYALINYYRAIEFSSIQMLAFAAASDWGGVSHCAQFCGELVQQLGRAKLCAGLTASQQLEKNQIMKRVLAIDAQIRYLAQPGAARNAYQYPQYPGSATRAH